VISGGEQFCSEFDLICAAGVYLELDYKQILDRLHASLWVTDIPFFVSLDRAQRKELVTQGLAGLERAFNQRVAVVDSQTGEFAAYANREQLMVTVILSEPARNDDGDVIRFFLPVEQLRLGVGHAGYIDGRYIFSVPYFLELELRNGVAVTGDATQFAIESD
jgi:hypothetical protein